MIIKAFRNFLLDINNCRHLHQIQNLANLKWQKDIYKQRRFGDSVIYSKDLLYLSHGVKHRDIVSDGVRGAYLFDRDSIIFIDGFQYVTVKGYTTVNGFIENSERGFNITPEFEEVSSYEDYLNYKPVFYPDGRGGIYVESGYSLFYILGAVGIRVNKRDLNDTAKLYERSLISKNFNATGDGNVSKNISNSYLPPAQKPSLKPSDTIDFNFYKKKK